MSVLCVVVLDTTSAWLALGYSPHLGHDAVIADSIELGLKLVEDTC